MTGMAVLAAVSCNVDSLEETTSGKGLSFDVVLENKAETRSDAMELISENGETALVLEKEASTRSVQVNNEGSFITVFNGSFEVEGSEGGANTVFHSTAAYNSTTGLWDLQNSTYVWKPFKRLEVVALAADSDFDNEAFFNGINYNGTPVSSGSFDYTVPDNLSPKDLLIGYYEGEAGTGTISLKFNHPLTSLQFKVGDMPEGATLTVNSISLENLDKSGHCIVGFGSPVSYTWNNYNGTVTYKKTFDNPQPMVSGTSFVDGDDTFIVLPRRFPHNTQARIVINVTEFNRNYDVYASLADQEWKPGETNVYAVTFTGSRQAILTNGADFNLAMSTVANGLTNIKHIVFEVGSDVDSGTEVQEPLQWPIYMNWDNTTKTITVSTTSNILYTGTNCASMFANLTALEDIQGLTLLNTSNCVDMSEMFRSCQSLTSLDLSNFNTENVRLMGGMFRDLKAMTTLDLSSFRTDNVISVGSMFRGESSSNRNSLRSINFGEHFQLPNNDGFAFTFAYTNLSGALDLSMFECSAMSDLEYMFEGSPSITSVDLSGLGENSTIFFAPSVFNGTNVSRINFGPNITFSGLNSSQTDGFFGTTASNLVVICNEAAETKLRTFGASNKVTSYQRP